ncbi:MAG: hypothetical protein K9H26_04960 [Prolixibacteraceae bacterium]|nr:hypothetical protein [Prolixibacteraceae bacterium]
MIEHNRSFHSNCSFRKYLLLQFMIKNATITIFCLLFSLQLLAQNMFTSSNLPIVLINTNGQEIPDEPKITADMKIIFNGEGERNAIDDENYNYNGHVGIELRGNSSLSFNQAKKHIYVITSIRLNL